MVEQEEPDWKEVVDRPEVAAHSQNSEAGAGAVVGAVEVQDTVESSYRPVKAVGEHNLPEVGDTVAVVVDPKWMVGMIQPTPAEAVVEDIQDTADSGMLVVGEDIVMGLEEAAHIV